MDKFTYSKGDLDLSAETACKQCLDCKFESSQIMSCKKYDRKPKGIVMNSGKCSYKENRTP